MGDFAVVDQLRQFATLNLDASASVSDEVNTYAWIELTASTAQATHWIKLQMIGPGGTVAVAPIALDIAIGGSGNEKIIIDQFVSAPASNIALYRNVDVMLPLSIPAGTRISARAYERGTTTDASLYFVLHLFNGACLSRQCHRLDYIGKALVPITTDSVAANTDTDYSQIVASTSETYRAFIFHPMEPSGGVKPNADFMMTLAIGGSGSEQALLPSLLLGGSSSTGATMPFMSPLYPIIIPSGSRLAIKGRSNATSGNRDVDVAMWGLV